ncbi:hypothetical protein F5Y11DRAFT_335132 [Daldinia sp. FL1419]|nr:hypothetical protein F5Y11DRAFT_335132 [Daldinia sp. FL1419]
MKIGDLLAEISGGNPSSEPRPKTPTSTSIKRKADDDSHSTTSNKYPKARQQDGTYPASKITRDVKTEPVERPRPIPASATTKSSSSLPHRTSLPSTNGRYQPPVPSVQRTNTSSSNGRPGSGSTSNTSQPKKSGDLLTSRPKLSSSSLAAASRAPPAKSSPTTPTASDPSKAPKKGSYQEIMERAKKAQASMGKVGVIQHKSIGTAKKEQPAKAEQKPTGAKGKDGKPYLGNSRSSTAPARGGTKPGTAVRDVGRNGAGKEAKVTGKSRPGSTGGEALEKKVKKSATATTGYTGTARPRPGAASNKASSSGKGGPGYKSGGLLAPPRPSRRDQYEDEYDDDMDDFIEYDDDEEPDYRGGRYGGYDSDASSDMEAGISDIDVEERRAELLGREEDKREQALEEKLKREKEERKRRLGLGR